jgi:hypothetical protein
MPETSRPYASKSDEELAALEQDRALPLDQWTEVERERGRRARAAAEPRAASANPRLTSGRLVQALADVNGMLVPGERLLAYAVQRRLFALTHRREVIAATTGRFIAIKRGLIGGFTPFDVRWQDLRDASTRAGIFGSDITITAMPGDDLASHAHSGGVRRTFMGLRKDQAAQVYKICQAEEQSWREKRRIRDIDEMRAESGGLQLGGIGGSASSVAAANQIADPAERLRRAKVMLDQGLISDAEYEAIKARVVDTL